VYTSNEECIASKDGLVIAVFKEEANTVLGMARRVQSGDFDAISDGECRFMGRCLCDLGTVFSADYRKRIALELVGINLTITRPKNAI
jgi:hypothetical protein